MNFRHQLLLEDQPVAMVGRTVVHRVFASNGSFVILGCGRKTKRDRLRFAIAIDPACKRCWP